jgi:hypothetical protein
MTVALSTLEPSLRIELPGILEPVLDDAITRVVRQFFWRSEAWKYTCDNGLDYTEDAATFTAPVAGTDIPANTIVKRIDTVKYNAGGTLWNKTIPFKTRDELDRENADWETETGTSPSAWTINASGDARPVPIASATVTDGFLFRCVIVPDTALTVLPNFLFYEYEETFKAGVIAYGEMYQAGIDEAKSRAEAGYGQPKDTMAYGGL